MKRFVTALVLLVATGATPNAQEPAPKVEFRNHSYFGTVTDITKTTITIEAPEYKITRSRFTPDGQLISRQDILIPAEPPKLFHASEVLASGKYAKDGVTRGLHLLTDVKKGDRVSILHSRVEGVDICETVTIDRRPGGRVPPGDGDEKRPANQRWDNRQNVKQFAEETLAPKWAPWMLVTLCR